MFLSIGLKHISNFYKHLVTLVSLECIYFTATRYQAFTAVSNEPWYMLCRCYNVHLMFNYSDKMNCH